MVNRLFFFLILCLLLAGQDALGQDPQVYQLSGLVVNQSSSEPVPFAQVRVNGTRRGTVCNQEGFYSMPVSETDTLVFSCLGYHKTFFSVAEYLEEYEGGLGTKYIYAINYLVEDSIMLPSVLIFPYNTYAELRTAIVQTKVPENIESVNARNNLNPKVLDVLIKTLAVDEGERIMTARQMYYNQYLHSHVAPTMPLFDPIAVYQLLRYINEKAKERKEKNLDYWSE